MAEYIEREAFVEQKRKQYCEDCNRRKVMKNGMYKTLYEIGEAPCRACGIDDMLNDVEDFPAADVRPVVRGKWEHTEDFDEYGGGRYVEWTCSKCFFKVKGGWAVRDSHIDEKPRENFCPNCGCAMGVDN